jgi:ATP-dependent DNA ligase I
MGCVLLRDVVGTSEAVTALPGRRAKIEQLAGLLRRAGRDEIPVVVAFLSGELRQRQIGVGYAALTGLLREVDAAAGGTGPAGGPGAAALTVPETDQAFADIGAVTGAGAQAARRALLARLFRRASAGERGFLIRLLAGELRQGAQEGVMIEAVARAAGVPATEVRRAHLLGGSLPVVAQAALTAAWRAGGAADGPATAPALVALRSFGLQVGRPLRPMLASSASTVQAAFGRLSPAAVEWKIDGIRVQVHRRGTEVAVFTRTLDDITSRVPEITEAVLGLDVHTVVLDGEAVALRPDGRPRPFQVTAGRTASQAEVARQRAEIPLTPFFFDLLHLDGIDLVDEPASVRHARMAAILPGGLLIPRLETADLAAAEAFFAGAVARGHEGVLVKSLTSGYAAGRRGSEWIKVKPRHTLDLVVLAAEWGHGRRRGWLSNLHLGARDPATGSLVMLGKTFKGLTDQVLRWQTERLLELAEPGTTPPAGRRAAYGVVPVRPELVVEVAFDGVQASPRYPGGVALRFARVLRYRPDKTAAEADTIGTVRALWPDAPEAPDAPPAGG